MILATRNEHKLRELAEILPGVDLQPLPAGVQAPAEDGGSFAANALIKARAAHALTGEAALADDSGSRPRHWEAGPASTRRAMPARAPAMSRTSGSSSARSELAGENRRAAYVCVIALVDERGGERTFEGRCEGRLTMSPRGAGGFGYDPVFVPDDTGSEDERTMAELSAEEKHTISHRGRAARRLAAHLGVAAEAPR